MQPDQARFLFSFLFPQLKTENKTTRKTIAAVPADRSNYSPHPASMTALKLCGHIAGTEIWFLAAILKHRFAEENDDDGAPPSKWDTPAEIIRWYDEELAMRLPKLEALSDEHRVVPVNYHFRPAVPCCTIGVRRGPASKPLPIIGRLLSR